MFEIINQIGNNVTLMGLSPDEQMMLEESVSQNKILREKNNLTMVCKLINLVNEVTLQTYFSSFFDVNESRFRYFYATEQDFTFRPVPWDNSISDRENIDLGEENKPANESDGEDTSKKDETQNEVYSQKEKFTDVLYFMQVFPKKSLQFDESGKLVRTKRAVCMTIKEALSLDSYCQLDKSGNKIPLNDSLYSTWEIFEIEPSYVQLQNSAISGYYFIYSVRNEIFVEFYKGDGSINRYVPIT